MLLLTVTIADPKRFTLKNKLVTYTRAFVKLYNLRNLGQVHKIHGIVEIEKIDTLIAENSCNLGTYRIIKIFSVLHSAHIIPRDQDKVMFYVNNYIDWD